MKAILGKLNDELLVNVASKAVIRCTHVDAAVAYTDNMSDHPLLRTCKDADLRLTFYGLLDETGAVGVAFLKELLSWGPTRAKVRLVKGHFHPKVIWWRGYGAYVGSANLTNKAWTQNIEAGVFLEEGELNSTGVGEDLDAMFDHLEEHSIPVIAEVVDNLETLSKARTAVWKEETRLKKKFDELFGHLKSNPGLMTLPARGKARKRTNKRLERFTQEWMETLQLMRGLAKEFEALKARPSWVDPDAHGAHHFDQFLHAYYYDYVRAGDGEPEEDDDLSGLEKVEAFCERNRRDPKAALREAARWWASLPSDRHGEADFIRHVAPDMQRMFAKEAVERMDLPAFTEAMRNVNAFRMHARQVKNADFGLPKDHHEKIDERVGRLCQWLWNQQSPMGRTVRDVLEFVIWGTTPSDMEQRLWLGVWDDEYRLPHFGQSSLGEAVGWARPDDYPPRNNRTNKALRALGHHNVRLF